MSDFTLPHAVAPFHATRYDSPSLLGLSLWIRALFVGASMFIAGLASWIDSGSRSNGMLALAAAGFVLGLASIVCAHDIMKKVSHRTHA